MAWLLLPFCSTDPYVRTAEAGGSYVGSDITSYETTCPNGSHVSAFNGRLDEVVAAIGPFNCTNGETLPLIGVSTIGKPWSHTAGSEGYTGVGIRAGVLLDQITLGGAFATATYGRIGGEDKGTQQCPNGTVVAGLFGNKTTESVLTIGLICRAPSVTGTCRLLPA